MSIINGKTIIERYPGMIPVIVDKASTSNLPEIQKKKFICPADISFSAFSYIIRKRIFLKPEKALFLFVNNKLPNMNDTMFEIYKQYKDNNNILHVVYQEEATFG